MTADDLCPWCGYPLFHPVHPADFPCVDEEFRTHLEGNTPRPDLRIVT